MNIAEELTKYKTALNESESGWNKPITLEFLWWFKRVAFFKGDFLREVTEICGNEDEAIVATMSSSFRNSDPVSFWYENKDESWFGPYMEKYLKSWGSY